MVQNLGTARDRYLSWFQNNVIEYCMPVSCNAVLVFYIINM